MRALLKDTFVEFGRLGFNLYWSLRTCNFLLTLAIIFCIHRNLGTVLTGGLRL